MHYLWGLTSENNCNYTTGTDTIMLQVTIMWSRQPHTCGATQPCGKETMCVLCINKAVLVSLWLQLTPGPPLIQMDLMKIIITLVGSKCCNYAVLLRLVWCQRVLGAGRDRPTDVSVPTAATRDWRRRWWYIQRERRWQDRPCCAYCNI